MAVIRDRNVVIVPHEITDRPYEVLSQVAPRLRVVVVDQGDAKAGFRSVYPGDRCLRKLAEGQ